MSIGLIGKKIGMTRLFSDCGSAYPVTVVGVDTNYVTQVKTMDIDGYYAIQVSTGFCSKRLLKKSYVGHFARSGFFPGRGLWEFRKSGFNTIKQGDFFSLNIFSVGEKIDITGYSKGKGFQGGVKRWNFHMQDATHGNSVSHRSIGSTGQCQTPGRVWKGKKMAGHMGHNNVTIHYLEIIRIDFNKKVLLLKGSVPGPSGSNLMLRPSIKVK